MAVPGIVLITGSAGRIGQAVVKALGAQPVRGLDRVPTPGLTDFVVGDITDPPTVHRAMQGIHTLIHLAATPDDADFLTELLPPNIVGVYHVLEAAREAGVHRIILASSGQVVWHQRFTGPVPITARDLPTPRYWYAVTKVFLEAAGQAYAVAHGINVIAVRLGWVPRNADHVRELAGVEWAKDVYLSPGDAGRFFACAVRAPVDLPFTIVYATSKPLQQFYYDLDSARQLLGFVPQDQWPQGVEKDLD
jgi:dTDP-4-dehydrorhamnose reductase